MLRTVFATAITLLASASFASAASLSAVSGPVLIDSGKGFVKVSAATDVKAGDRILVSKSGSAVLAYSDACKMTLSANTVTSVDPANACKSASGTAQVAAADLTPDNYVAPAPMAVVPAATPSMTPVFIVGGALLAAGVAAIIIGNNNNDNNVVPVSF